MKKMLAIQRNCKDFGGKKLASPFNEKLLFTHTFGQLVIELYKLMTILAIKLRSQT